MFLKVYSIQDVDMVADTFQIKCATKCYVFDINR